MSMLNAGIPMRYLTNGCCSGRLNGDVPRLDFLLGSSLGIAIGSCANFSIT
jgi:hypothetical protein